MLIASAQISMGASHQLQKQLSLKESLTHIEQTTQGTRQVSLQREREFTQEAVDTYRSTASPSNAMAEMQAMAGASRGVAIADRLQGTTSGVISSASLTTSTVHSDLPTTRDELQAQMIRQLLHRMYGIGMQERPLSRELWQSINALEGQALPSGAGLDISTGVRTDYQLEQSYYEAERSVFTATGEVLTADGKRLQFSVEVGLAREFSSNERLSFSQGNLYDPLVIEFGGSSSTLGSTRFAFDLTSSGRSDWLPTLGEGRGFLALDRNADGLINDGSELFGPSTGQGFGELAQLDEDGNGWLDEADSAYQHLRVWVPDAQGEGQLFALADLGVGAIYLTSQSMDFRFTDAGNNTLAQLRETGLYLTESGQAGLIRQIDLSV